MAIYENINDANATVNADNLQKALIDIGNKQYYIGVLVNRILDDSNKLHVHDVATIEKEATDINDTVRDISASPRMSDTSYVKRLLKKALNVNSEHIIKSIHY